MDYCLKTDYPESFPLEPVSEEDLLRRTFSSLLASSPGQESIAVTDPRPGFSQNIGPGRLGSLYTYSEGAAGSVYTIAGITTWAPCRPAVRSTAGARRCLGLRRRRSNRKNHRQRERCEADVPNQLTPVHGGQVVWLNWRSFE